MPSVQIHPPTDWQAFERLCADLWGRLWPESNVLRFGRTGQEQGGVDLFARRKDGTWAVVQCKLKDQRKGKKLTAAEMKEEVEAAKGFHTDLKEVVFATTAARDTHTQKAAMDLAKSQGVEVTVLAWDDIEGLLLRDYPRLAETHGLLAPGTVAVKATREDYLRRLVGRMCHVRLAGLSQGDRGDRIPLAEVYTALDVRERVRLAVSEVIGDALRKKFPERAKNPPPVAKLPFRGDEEYARLLGRRLLLEITAGKTERHGPEGPWSNSRPLTALEAAAACRRLVLLGPAGSGKSTFTRYLALCLAGEELGDRVANFRLLNAGDEEAAAQGLVPWPHGAPLPIFVELRKLVQSQIFAAARGEGSCDLLLDYLKAEDAAGGPDGPLRHALLGRQGGCLVILDGLDETPADEGERRRLKEVIESLAASYPVCRILVTSRPYAYRQGDAWRLDQFETVELAAFNGPKAEAYVQGWYRSLAANGQMDGERAEALALDLVKRLAGHRDLGPLAERPLMLAMIGELHVANNGLPPGGRAGLYEESVRLLLDRWNQVRGVQDKDLTQRLGLSVEQMRRALERLAFEVHGRQGAVQTRGRSAPGAADLSAGELFQALERERVGETLVDQGRVMGYLHQRAGILQAESRELYRFPHRTYQEFLAACHLVRASDFPRNLRDRFSQDPALWREVTLLAAGRSAGTATLIWPLLNSLVPTNPEGVTADDPRFARVHLAGIAAAENLLEQRLEPEHAETLQLIRRWLERCLELGALEPRERVEVGRALGAVGDGRAGVGVREDGVPDILWVEVPAGKFVMGSPDDRNSFRSGKETPQHEEDLVAYRIAKYPVTNAQFQAFVADGGYTDRWRQCWTSAGWAWKEVGKRQGPNDGLREDFLLPNHPRVAVSWYEAWAFSRWLGTKLVMRCASLRKRNGRRRRGARPGGSTRGAMSWRPAAATAKNSPWTRRPRWAAFPQALAPAVPWT